MEQALEIILGLFIAVVALGLLAKKLNIPYPIALVIGGLLLSFIPELPPIELDPDLIFLTILPPILFSGGYFTSAGAFRSNIGPIFLLAVGLVVITTIAVAVFAHFSFDLIWPAAFVLGAIVSPPDAIAATAITQRLKVSHHIMTILDGESLVNDASALVIYRLSLAAIAASAFSLFHASIEFITVCIGGIAFGLIFGWLSCNVLKRITDASLCITISFLLPYLSYLTADNFKMSGVLAAVTSGLYLGWQLPIIVSPIIRLETSAIWKMVIFLLNGAAFILIGLQLPLILEELRNYSTSQLIWYAVGLNAVIIGVRLAWVFFSIYLPNTFNFKWKRNYPYLDLKNSIVVGWCGMRGIVSLAAALAIPISVGAERFPDRSLIIFLTFTVIFATLVFQGLTLPFIIRKLGVIDTASDLVEEAKVRMKTSLAAIERLKEISKNEKFGSDIISQMKVKYEDRIQWASSIIGNVLDDDLVVNTKTSRDIQLELLKTEREKIVQLRNKGLISNEVMRRTLNDIDFEAARLQQRNDHV